jgi:hypothetical protein
MKHNNLSPIAALFTLNPAGYHASSGYVSRDTHRSGAIIKAHGFEKHDCERSVGKI